MSKSQKHRINRHLATAAAVGALGLGSAVMADSATWSDVTTTTPADWNLDANWGGTAYPKAAGEVADISADLTTVGKTINLNVPITIGAMNLSDTGATNDRAFVIAAGTAGTLTFDNGASNATVSVSAATFASGVTNHSISAPTYIGGNGIVDVITNARLDISNLNGGSGTLINKSGSSILRLNNSLAAFTGSVSVNAGSLQIYSNTTQAGATYYLNGSTAAGGPVLRYTASGNTNNTGTLASKVVALGNVTLESDHGSIDGDSTVQLSSVDLKLVSGETGSTLTVSQVGGSNNLFVINNPKLYGDLTMAGGNNQRGVTLSNITTDSSALMASLTKTGTHLLRVNGTGSYGGGTTVNGGILAVETNAALGTGAVSVVSGVFRVGVSNYTPTHGTLSMASGTTERWSTTLARLGASNTTVASYTLQSGVNLSLQTDLNIALASGFTAANPQKTIQLNGGEIHGVGGTKYDSALTNNGTGRIIGPGVALELIADSRIGSAGTTGGGSLVNLTVNGVIRDDFATSGFTRSLTKIGTQTVTLSAANTYTGNTNVTAGTLVVGLVGSLGSGNVHVTPTTGANTVLRLDNNNAIDDDAVLELNYLLAGSRYGQVNLNFDGALSETVKILIIDGVAQEAGIYTATTTPNFITGTGSLTVLAVPEPTSLGLMGAGAAYLLGRRRRNKPASAVC